MNGEQISARRIAPAYMQVADQLREAIIHGDVDPGSKLPTEPRLSEMFGVSRSTVREAIRVLASQNLVRVVRGVKGGMFVAHPNSDDVRDFLETSLGLLSKAQEVGVDELVDTRSLLEVPAARLAAIRRSDEDLAAMWRTVEDEERALSAGFAGHAALHTVILQASGNGLLGMMTTPIFTVLRSRFLRDEAPSHFWADVAHDHRLIVERIADGDADGAAAEMSSHLDELRALYTSIDSMSRRDVELDDDPGED